MMTGISIVQVIVLYVTVMLVVFLYAVVLRKQKEDETGLVVDRKRLKYLTFALASVITMIFGVGCAHQIWPQENDLWYGILGILILCVTWIVYRLRRLPPSSN